MLLLFLLDADCSGRTLATLLVAWVAAAMIASVLLRWEYMWIVLTILTLLFLIVCGYIAYSAKRAHARALIDERRRATNARERRERQIWTVSGITADNRGETEPSIYANRLIADLPPPYASVVLVQETSASSRDTLAVGGASICESKSEEPPPYSAVIPSANTLRGRNAEISNETNVLPSTPTTKKSDASSDPADMRRARDD